MDARRSSSSWSRYAPLACVALVVAVAAVMRLALLELKPPHHDEGVNGVFIEKIIEFGYYRYDPNAYHGPLHFYLLAGARELFGFGLWQLRLVPALLGVVLCALPFVLRSRIGLAAATGAGLLLALSPAMVYFARHAIHETLLVVLMVGSVLAFYQWATGGGGRRWLFVTAACVGGMIATKETVIIYVALAGLWMVVDSGLLKGTFYGRPARLIATRGALLTVAGLLAVIAVIHLVTFTGGFRDPQPLGETLRDSVASFFAWGHKGADQGVHVKPWHYYLELLGRYEAALLPLAVVGLWLGWKDRVLRACGVLGLGLLFAYSLVSYKTPWLMINWIALLAIPAGHAISRPGWASRGAAVAALALATWGAVGLNFFRPADPAEKLAYVQTLPGYNDFSDRLEAAAVRKPTTLTIRVIAEKTWPIPWTVRPYRVKWGSHRGGPLADDVIVVDAHDQTRVEADLVGAYEATPLALRPFRGELVVLWRLDGVIAIETSSVASR